jgi:hypothetical protein
MSIGATALSALKARLEKITNANGYAVDVKTVRLNRSAMDLDVPDQECPLIDIIQDGTTPEHGASSHIKDETDFILLLVHGKDVDDLVMEDFVADVRACLYADNPNGTGNTGINLGGTVTKMQWKGLVYDLNMIAANRRYAMTWTMIKHYSTYQR